MLEGLFSQLSAKSPPPITPVPLVPPIEKHGEPLKATYCKAVPPAPSVPSKKTETKASIKAGTLAASDRQKLLDYLAAIGETDQDMIDEVLTECGKDAAILARTLQQADDYLRINAGDTTGLVQCSGCRQLAGDACQRYGWRVVVDKWRQCGGFEVLQKTPVSKPITCKACSHFQSYHPHGGGAGVCGAGVQPFGACWWADTLHECNESAPLKED